MNHTPGPWTTQSGHNVTICPDDKDYFTVAIAFQNMDQNHREVEANARLIAAAPEMLEALQYIVGCAEPGGDDQAYIRLEALQKARAAIAKAKGQ